MLRPRLLTLLCYGAMMSLAIGVNLLPVFLTSLSLTFGGQDGLSQEELVGSVPSALSVLCWESS
jgi:hypothetical protein